MGKILTLVVALLISSATLKAQKKVSGNVTDDNGAPVSGASVVVTGTKNGTTTKSDGSFTLTVAGNAKTLTVTAIGMAKQVIEIGNNLNFAIKLGAEVTDLSEVVVQVPYGSTKKKTFTGSLTTISSENIGKQQISNFTRALEGAVPGVQVTSGSGQPGAGSTIRIRGIGSINASAAPLFVVDGIPYGGDFNSINPADIENITVLKDAASTALYGARAANGVILVSTKKGKGKPKVDIQSRYGINQRGVPEYDIIKDPGEFLEVYWQALRNEAMFRLPASGPLNETQAGLYASQTMFGAARLNNYRPYKVPAGEYIIDPVTGKLNTNAELLYHDDWQDAMFDNRSRQEHVISVSGASDKTEYYLSAGYLQDKGYIVKSDFKRFTTRLKLDQQINSWFKAGVNLTYGKSTQNNSNLANTSYQNAFYFTRLMAPVYPVHVRDANGAFVLDNKGRKIYDFGAGTAAGSMGNRIFGGTENTRATLDLDIRSIAADNFSERAYVKITPMKNLALTINHGIDLSFNNDVIFQNPTYGNAASLTVSGRGTIRYSKFFTENYNQLLNYSPSFRGHNLDFLVGHESYKLTVNNQSGQNQLYIFPTDPQLSSGAQINYSLSSVDVYTVEGYLSQLRYDFKSRYFFSASFRRDGSSRFAPGKQWGNFWSAGAGWDIASETFMNNVNWVSLLKLKASIGEKGNDNLNYVASVLTGANYYPYSTQYQINQTGALNLSNVYNGNENITWEKSRDYNVGIEFGIFKNITGTLEWFRRETSDLLFPKPLAFSSGIQSIPDNIGNMYNQGWEIDLTWNIFKKSDFSWQLSANATKWKNRITRLPDEQRQTGIVNGNQKLMEGHSIYEFFTWQYAGVDQATGNSLWWKETTDAATGKTERSVTHVFADATRSYTGKVSTPDFAGGVSTQLNFKNFDFSVFTNFGVGGWVYDDPYQDLMHAGGNQIQNWHRDILKAWQPGGNGSSIPRVHENYQDANASSDRWLIKGDYFNIRNISLGYSLPQQLLGTKSGFSALRISVSADNVLLISKRQGLDPRQSFDGTIDNVYSPIRTVSVGLNVSF